MKIIDPYGSELVKDYTRIIRGLKDRKKAIAFLIIRNGTSMYLVVKPE